MKLRKKSGPPLLVRLLSAAEQESNNEESEIQQPSQGGAAMEQETHSEARYTAGADMRSSESDTQECFWLVARRGLRGLRDAKY